MLSALETSLRRKIGRRLTLARWAKILIVPTLGGAIYLRHLSPWFACAGLALILLEILGIMVGEAQRCPLCDASLVIRHDRVEDFATQCPDCGFVID